MRFSQFLDEEWRPALGCTEPASIAWAAACAAAQTGGEPTRVHVTCDPRMYKNCFAVGIAHSGHKVGIRWAAALGALLADTEARLEIFRGITPEVLTRADALLGSDAVTVEVDARRDGLWIDCTVESTAGSGRAVLAEGHTRLVQLERDGVAQPLPEAPGGVAGPSLRSRLAAAAFADLIAMARGLEEADRARLRRGVACNLAIAEHGLGLLPEPFVTRGGDDPLHRIGQRVCAGVYARMWGEDLVVFSLAGSGNKGIVCAVPLALWGEHLGAPPERVDEALALACLITSAVTAHLGTLSAMCGSANAAGIGLAAGVVLLEGGGEHEVSLAVTNMVGNLTGMICDGAKIGCALKGMSAVDAAFRAAALALSGLGIPATDGIVGADGRASLVNLGRIAGPGMAATEPEILAIMSDKIRSGPAATD